VTLANAGQGRAGAPPGPGGAGAPGAAPRAGGGGGGGRGAIDPTQAPDGVYVVASDGFLHALNVSDGTDLVPRMRFIPNNAQASALIVADNVVYTSTSNGCGATPNAVWALDWASDKKSVTSWTTPGGSVAGTSGVALGTDGTVYASVGEPSSMIVALEPKTLKLKDSFTQPRADFNSTPVVFPGTNRDLVAATGADGKLYLLDGKSMKTPLTTAQYSAPGFSTGALSTFQDAAGARWILAPSAAVP